MIDQVICPTAEKNLPIWMVSFNLKIVTIKYWIEPAVFLPTGILWLNVSSSKFANYISIMKEIGYIMNVSIVTLSLLSRFKLCFEETQIFLTISYNKISFLFKTRISVNESNFPDLLITRILKTRLVSLITFFYFYNIVMSEKF